MNEQFFHIERACEILNFGNTWEVQAEARHFCIWAYVLLCKLRHGFFVYKAVSHTLIHANQ